MVLVVYFGLRLIGSFYNANCREDDVENKWSAFLNSLELFSDDFMSDGREQPAVQEREAL